MSHLSELNSLTGFDYSLLSITSISVALELFVLWLIVRKSASSLHEYRFYLCGTTASDLFFAFTIGFVIQPDPWIPVSLGTAVKGLARYIDSDYTAQLAFALSTFALSCQLLFQTFAMIFRYVIVMGQLHPQAKEFVLKKSTKIVIFCSILFASLLVAAISFFAFSTRMGQFYSQLLYQPKHGFNSTNSAQNHTADMDALLSQFGKYLNRIPAPDSNMVVTNIRSMLYTEEQKLVLEAFCLGLPIIYPDWGAALSMLLMMAIMLGGLFLVQIVCIVMGVAIIRYLRKNSKDFAQQAYKQHMQLIVLLLLQMFEPLLFIVLPVFYVCYGLISYVIGVNLPYPGLSNGGMHFGLLLLAIYPTLNSLLTMLFVSSYRKFVLKMLHLDGLAKMVGSIFRGHNQVMALQQRQMYPMTTTKTCPQ